MLAEMFCDEPAVMVVISGSACFGRTPQMRGDEAAMAALASLRAPIDRFFDSVTVNDEDAAKRSARLDLLSRFRAAVHEVADFSKIEG